jgi:hypothetical protein
LLRRALETAKSAPDPVIRAVYAGIPADVHRHAELTFRFVKWALENGGEATRALVERASRSESGAYGVREVVLPCLTALLDHVASPRRESVVAAAPVYAT